MCSCRVLLFRDVFIGGCAGCASACWESGACTRVPEYPSTNYPSTDESLKVIIFKCEHCVSTADLVGCETDGKGHGDVDVECWEVPICLFKSNSKQS